MGELRHRQERVDTGSTINQTAVGQKAIRYTEMPFGLRSFVVWVIGHAFEWARSLKSSLGSMYDGQRGGLHLIWQYRKGMRAQQFPVNGMDAVHVYSDDTHIWVQLRRDEPTDLDIGRTSFKFAICLQPGTAHKLGLELINVAD